MTLIIYDITNDRLRTRLADYLKSRGLKRIQKSAFIGPLTDSERKEIAAKIYKMIKGQKANVQIFPLTWASYKHRLILGIPTVEEEEESPIL